MEKRDQIVFFFLSLILKKERILFWVVIARQKGIKQGSMA